MILVGNDHVALVVGERAPVGVAHPPPETVPDPFGDLHPNPSTANPSSGPYKWCVSSMTGVPSSFAAGTGCVRRPGRCSKAGRGPPTLYCRQRRAG